jgi:D-alanyl-D-alanine carboxypeptidase/D-alanyl-D-alanine-endopeptidase (penicillin-binding protein 4)
VDGTLRRRFRNTALEGRLFAKTGSLNASSALAGYLTAASGRTLTFAFFANDVPQDMAVTGLMERVLVAVATGG